MWENKEIRLLSQLPKYTIGTCRPCSSGRTLSKVIFNSFGVDRRNRGGALIALLLISLFRKLTPLPSVPLFFFRAKVIFHPAYACVCCVHAGLLCVGRREFLLAIHV